MTGYANLDFGSDDMVRRTMLGSAVTAALIGSADAGAALELLDELVDVLAKEDDTLEVACSLLIQLTRFVGAAGGTAKDLAHGAT